MAIRFKCPRCETAYQVRDELAGKQAPCKKQGCGEVLTIPRPEPSPNGKPAPAPPADADHLAASLLSQEDPEKQAAAREAVGKPIPVTCDACDEKFEVGPDKAGKNVLCPECKHRIRVPELKVEKPKDWREVDKRAAVLKTEEPDDHTWSTKHTTLADRSSVRDAGALLEEEREPVPVLRRISQGMLAAAALGAVAFGVIYLRGLISEEGQKSTMADAEKAFNEANGQSPLPATWQAAFHLAAARHDLQFAVDAESRQEAEKHFTSARGNLSNSPPGFDRDLMVIELARHQVGLGGTPEQLEVEARLPWDAVQTQLRQTIQRLGNNNDVREEAFRQLTRALAEPGEAGRAASVAMMPSLIPPAAVPDLAALVAFERLRAGDTKGARQTYDVAVAKWQTAGQPASPWLQAVNIALAAKDPEVKTLAFLPTPNQSEPSPASRFGYAVGFALAGEIDKAMTLATQAGRPEPKLRALVGIADALLASEPSVAGQALDAAGQVLAKELAGDFSASWPAYRLAELNARAGRIDAAAAAAEAVLEPTLKGWAQLAVLRGKLAATPDEPAADDLAQKVATPNDLAHALARHALGEHNGRIDASDAERAAKDLDAKLMPFGLAGVALGSGL